MKTRRFDQTVKHIGTQRFELAVLKDQDDMYCIAYQTVYDNNTHYSENICDFKLASSLFDIKLMELEGQ
jgi:hypothetical protein